MNYASSGLGSSLHLFAEIFKNTAGIDILHIPYRGDAPMITAMIAGDVQLAFLPQATGQAAIQGGRVRALAVTGRKRMPQLPDTPTLAELGITRLRRRQLERHVGAGGTPPAIVLAIQQAMAKVLADPRCAERFRAVGAEPVGNTPEQFAAQFKADIARFADIIEKAKIPKLD